MIGLVLIHLAGTEDIISGCFGDICAASVTNLDSCFVFSYLSSKENSETRLKVSFCFGFVSYDLFFFSPRQPHCLPWTNIHMQTFQILTVLALS